MLTSGQAPTAFLGPRQARVYANCGTPSLIDLLNDDWQDVLDVGCGDGANARLLKARHPDCRLFGITHSPLEAARARRHMVRCWVADVEEKVPAELVRHRFDVVIFCHVLEHLRHPAAVVSRYVALLRKGGRILIAVPNVLAWRQRSQFLRGRFEYESSGTMDDTHVRFFTYLTADKYLLAHMTNVRVVSKGVTGSVPLWFLRRCVLPTSWSKTIDTWGCRLWPNLFGGQVLIKGRKT